MFRTRGENFRAVHVLMFLNVALFLLQYQDRLKFVRLFRFDAGAIRLGEVWRLFTWQFTQGGSGFMSVLSLFITLLLLYMMGSALEEQWGTVHFVTLFAISTLGSAGVAAFLGVPLLGAYFVYFTLLFVYAAAFPQQTFFLFGMVPVRVRVLALFSLAVLLYGVFSGGAANIAALGGAVAAYAYYLTQRIRVKVVVAAQEPVAAPRVRIDTTAIRNSARYAAIRQMLGTASDADIDRLIAQAERETVPNVNICPPADYKPESVDGYCIRCEGFAECSARYLRLNRPARHAAPALAVPNPDARA